jgi:hypothetical protein
MKRMKSLSVRTAKDCIKRELALSLPVRKRNAADRNKRPLFAWLRGTPKCNTESPIALLKKNQARWPWYTLNTAGYEVFKKVTKTKEMTFLQSRWLMDLIAKTYPGRYDGNPHLTSIDAWFDFKPTDRQRALRAAHETEVFINAAFEKLGIDWNCTKSLRLIKSPELSCIINLKFMELYGI